MEGEISTKLDDHLVGLNTPAMSVACAGPIRTSGSMHSRTRPIGGSAESPSTVCPLRASLDTVRAFGRVESSTGENGVFICERNKDFTLKLELVSFR